MHAHVLRGRIKRVVPNDNEAVNETWLSDRDRFSYEGIYSSDRLLKPRIKENGEWRDIDWQDALQKLAESLGNADAGRIGLLISPSATVEENHLLARIADHLKTTNIDHRIRRQDFADQHSDPLFPWLGCDIADVENADAILVAGSNLRNEAPIIAHRVRKAALRGSQVCFANSSVYDYQFDLAAYSAEMDLVVLLAGVAVAAADGTLPIAVKSLCKGIKATAEQQKIAEVLKQSEKAHVLTGVLAERHPHSSAVRALASAIADLTGSSLGALSGGANSAGAYLAGALPHRERGGAERSAAGRTAADMLTESSDAVLLFGLEPEFDLACIDDAVEHLSEQKFVAAFTPYKTYALESCADLLLPIGTFAESSGTFVNCEGRWQSFTGVANPVGEARPGWKVLRVLANLLDVADSDYQTSLEIRDELVELLGEISPDNSARHEQALAKQKRDDEAAQDIDVPIYQADSIVRRAVALQLTPAARRSRGELV